MKGTPEPTELEGVCCPVACHAMGDTLKGPPTTTIPPLQRNVFSTTTTH